MTGLVVAAAAAYLMLTPNEPFYEATTSLILQEPVSSEGLISVEVAAGPFVASQLEIMSSPVVEAEAADLLSATGVEVDATTVSAAIDVTGSSESPVVTITATHPSADMAVAIANAVADGYRLVSSRQATATAQSQLTQVAAQLDGVEERLAEIERELVASLEVDASLAMLEAEAREALELISDLKEALLGASQEDAEAIRQQIGDYQDRIDLYERELAVALQEEASLARHEAEAREAMELIPDLQDALVGASDEDAELIRQQIADYRDRIQVFEQVSSTFSDEPGQTSLLEEQSNLIARRAELQTLSDQITIDAELAPDAIALVQEAQEASQIGTPGITRTLGVAGGLGLALGVLLAYLLAVSRRSFAGRTEPESILGAPLLADIPDFADEGLRSTLPVIDNPRSAAAEAYRFAASSLAVTIRNRGIRSLAVLTATEGRGKTTTLVNTAFAAALDRSSVLVIDCDFGNQEASRLLLEKGQMLGTGLTDILEGTASIDSALQRVELGGGTQLQWLGRGTHPALAATSLQSDAAAALFKTLADRFDLVLVDSPPLLQVAYASRIVEMVEGVIVVVEHKSAYREAEDLSGRISLLSTPVVGYVYNRSPLRREMTRSEGSTGDIVVDHASGDLLALTRKRYRKFDN